MITRIVKVQVILFTVLSLLGVAYVGLRYVGVGERLFGSAYTVHADFATAGGIFPNAAVTYRGVPVGKVTAVRLHGDAVRVDLDLAGGVPIPTSLHAVVAHRSAVGEEYVDLRPDTDAGPYLRDGDVIPVTVTGTPLPVETLLSNLDALVGSVDPTDLATVIDELGTAFAGHEDALRQILAASDELLDSATRSLPQTLELIQDSQVVLTTQAQSADAIRRWAKALAQLAHTIRVADPDLRRLLAAAPDATSQLTGLLRDLDPTIGTLLGNLITVNGIAARRLNGIEQILVVFPLTVAGGFTVAPGDGTAHFGLVVNANNPPACQYQHSGQTSCTASEQAQGSGVRGSNRAPGPAPGETQPAPLGPPGSPGSLGSTAGGAPSATTTLAGFDPVTGVVVGPDGIPLQFGGTGGQAELTGDQSWKQLLLIGLAP